MRPALEQRPVAILLRNDAGSQRPLNTEGRIVESDTTNGRWRVEPGGHIVHFSVLFESLISVRTVLGHAQHSAVNRRQLGAVPFAVRWGSRPEIKYDVKNGTAGTPHQLGFEGGGLLEVHAPDCPFPGAKPHVRLDGGEIDPVLRKLSRAPHSHKPAPIVPMWVWIDQYCTKDVGRPESHRKYEAP